MPRIQYQKKKGIKDVTKIPTSASEFRALSKLERAKFKKKRVTTANAFPGTITGSPTINNNTPGLFTQTIKGMRGKHYIEAAVKDALRDYKALMPDE